MYTTCCVEAQKGDIYSLPAAGSLLGPMQAADRVHAAVETALPSGKCLMIANGFPKMLSSESLRRPRHKVFQTDKETPYLPCAFSILKNSHSFVLYILLYSSTFIFSYSI